MNRMYLVALIAISFFLMIMYSVYDAFILAAVMIAAPLAALIITYAIHRHLTVSFALPEDLVRNQNAHIIIAAKGRGTRFLSDLSASIGGITYKGFPASHGFSFSLPLSFPHCGKETIPEGTVAFSDPFGIHHFKMKGLSREIIVLPQKIGKDSKIIKLLRSLENNEDKEYYGAVPYQRGDNLRLVNWKVTARKGSLFVREPWPVSSEKIAFAADLPENPDERDVIGDVLFSCGDALLRHQESFLFCWTNTKHQPIAEKIADPSAWRRSIKEFLSQGSVGSLAQYAIAPETALLYLKSSSSPKGDASAASAVWSSVQDPRASLSGHQLLAALGGTNHE